MASHMVLLDKDFEPRFINRADYRMFVLTPPPPPPPPAATHHLADLIAYARAAGVYDTGEQAMDDYVREHLALIARHPIGDAVPGERRP